MNELIKKYDNITSENMTANIELNKEKQSLILAIDDSGFNVLDSEHKIALLYSIIYDLKLAIRQ